MRRISILFICVALAGCATAAQRFQKEPPTPCEAATAALSDARAFEAFARGTGNPLLIGAAVGAVAGAAEYANLRCVPVPTGA